MKRILFLLAMNASFYGNAQAQEWAPPSAEWTYEWWTLTQTGYVSMFRAEDTVITGFPSQKLEVERHIHDHPSSTDIHDHIGPYYTSVNGQLISIWDGTGFDTLYWFGAGPGDHWTVPLLGTPQTASVNDSGTVMMDGVLLKYLTVAYGTGPTAWDTIFERFGSRNIFIDASLSLLQIDAPIGWLRCYGDDQLAVGATSDCYAVTGIAEAKASDPVQVWPDPFTDRLTIDGMPSGSLILFDISGRRVMGPVHMQGGPLTMDVSMLLPGMYAMHLQTGDHARSIAVVKQ